MRLRRLVLTDYGHFARQAQDFDTRAGRVTVLLAPNGAGKSVLRQAITDLLFKPTGRAGFHFRSETHIAAEVVAPDGAAHAFGRRRGNGNTLTRHDSREPLDAAVLDALLRGTGRETFERLFSLDTAALRTGGQALLGTGGALAEAMLAAAGGIGHATALRRRLEERRDAIAPERKTGSRPFWSAIDRRDAARAQAKARRMTEADWRKRDDARDALRRAYDEATQDASRARSRRNQLARILRARPCLAQFDAARAWLEDNTNAPRLAADFAARLDAAETARAACETDLAQAREKHQNLAARADAPVADENLLAEEPPLSDLARRAGAAEQAGLDLPGLRQQLAGADERLALLLSELGSDLPLDRALEAARPKLVVAQARRALGKLNAALAAQETCESEVRTARDAADMASRTLARHPPAADHAALTALCRATRADGDPSRLMQAAQEAASDAAATRDDALSRIQGWRGDMQALRAWAVPTEADIRVAWMALEGARESARVAASDLAAAAREQSDLRGSDETAPADLTTPGQDRLTAARALRDAGWHLIYRHAFTPDIPAADEVAAFAGAMPLPLAYAESVRAADAIADRRFVSATALATNEARAAAIERADAKHRESQVQEAAARARLDAADMPWRQICAALHQPHGSTRDDLDRALKARDRALEAALAAERAAAKVERLFLLQRVAASAFRTALAEAGPEVDQDLPLSALLAHADRVIEAEATAAKLRIEATTKHSEALDRLRNAERSLAAARSAAEEQRVAWRTVLESLGRSPEESPDATESVLSLLEHVSEAVGQRLDKQQRVAETSDAVTKFAIACTAIALRLGESSPRDPLAWAHQRSRQASEAARAFAVREADRAALKDETAAVKRLREKLVRSETALATLLKSAGADTLAEAHEGAMLSKQRALQEAARQGAEQELLRHGDQLSLNELRAECATLPEAEADAALGQAEANERAAEDRAREALTQAVRVEAEIDADDGGAALLDAVAEEQAALGVARRTLDEALAIQLALLMLDRGMQAVRDAGTSAYLDRIGAAFATLTCGACAGVRAVEDNHGALTLRAVLPDRSERAIGELSEGTADQLFLAFRIVAIEDHARETAPLPFIGDDILQTSDDARAAAGVRALSALAERTQVLLFTHHAHVASLAGRQGATVVRLDGLALRDAAE